MSSSKISQESGSSSSSWLSSLFSSSKASKQSTVDGNSKTSSSSGLFGWLFGTKVTQEKGTTRQWSLFTPSTWSSAWESLKGAIYPGKKDAQSTRETIPLSEAVLKQHTEKEKEVPLKIQQPTDDDNALTDPESVDSSSRSDSPNAAKTNQAQNQKDRKKEAQIASISEQIDKLERKLNLFQEGLTKYKDKISPADFNSMNTEAQLHTQLIKTWKENLTANLTSSNQLYNMNNSVTLRLTGLKVLLDKMQKLTAPKSPLQQ